MVSRSAKFSIIECIVKFVKYYPEEYFPPLSPVNHLQRFEFETRIFWALNE